MSPAASQPVQTPPTPATLRRVVHHLGCVSFLNSKPLIDPLVGHPEIAVHFAVPSHLLDLFEGGTVSAALMSVVDYQSSKTDLLLLPAGMIGCDGHTLTVRIFSRVPLWSTCLMSMSDAATAKARLL